MAKNTRWSVEDFKKKNLVANKDGVFVNVSSLVQKGKVPKIDPNYAFMKPTHVSDLPNVKYPMTIDECCTMQSQDTAKTMEVIKDCAAYGTAITRTEIDLFGHVTTTVISPPVAALDPLSGEYILWVRTLTGKARDNAVRVLNDLAVNMMQNADKDCFYISGNVPSLKNGKSVVTVKNINKKTGKSQKFSTLVPSKAVKDYIKETKSNWLQNKISFKNAVKGLPLPISIEFTFIRKSLHHSDFINLNQIIQDLMIENEYLPDDDTVHFHPVFNRVTYYHSGLAGILIRILK